MNPTPWIGLSAVLLLGAVTNAQKAQPSEFRFSMTETAEGCQKYELRLAWLRERMTKKKKPMDPAQLAAIQESALAGWKKGKPIPRMLAVRTIGVLAGQKGAQPILHKELLAATRANSRQVRWEAVVQLRNAPYPTAKLREGALKALSATARAHAKDPTLHALANAAVEHLKQPAAKKMLGVGFFAGRRMRANESAAIATLRNITSAQAQCQASGVIDTDSDGCGEYGFLAELAGKVGVRTDAKGGVGADKISPPVLSGAFAKVGKHGIVRRSGYCYRVFLANKDGVPLCEADTGGGKGRKVDTRLGEICWCVYAWPETFGKTGRRVFFVNQEGDVIATNNDVTRYEGYWMPHGDAAFAASESVRGEMTGKTAVGKRPGFGRDGALWYQGGNPPAMPK